VSSDSCQHPEQRGVEHPGVIDYMEHDSRTDEITLVMVETRPWDGSDLQRFQLQEKMNAYLSFILDGEMIWRFSCGKGAAQGRKRVP
jgi:hypothetical protein